MKTTMTDGEKDLRWGPVVNVFASASKTGVFYEVRAKADGSMSCQCRGWVFHHHCKHCDATRRSGDLRPFSEC